MSFVRRIIQSFGSNRSSEGGGEHTGPRAPASPIAFADLSEMPDPAVLPPLDRPGLNESLLTPEQAEWRRDGVATLRRFLPHSVVDPYIARREQLRTEAPEHYRGGWYTPTPYEHVPELRVLALYPPLMRMMEQLIGEPMMMHLNLTGWVSTERNWHQDDYLNPPHVNSWYAAVWIALDHIDPDAGPFEYVPGSHRWPLLRQKKVLACMTREEAEERDPVRRSLVWPKTSERFVVPAIAAELSARNATVEQFRAEKGDVLIWHGRLMHRGSLPRSADMLRRSLIVHYSGITHRPDMAARLRDENGMYYFAANNPLW
jgi:hypothetical protein